MISEQDKQAILNGAYGITRNGTKVKYLFTSDVNSPQSKCLFAEYIEKEGKLDFHNSLWLSEDFKFYTHSKEHKLDVVGLWKDKPEPFDLERALAGEPVMLRNGNKAFVKFQVPEEYLDVNYPLIGYQVYEDNSIGHRHWTITGSWSMESDDRDSFDIIGMWKEPEPVSNTVTLTLPCPLKEPREGMWFIQDVKVIKSSYTKKNHLHNQEMLDDVFYFATKEEAQAWLDALKNNRR